MEKQYRSQGYHNYLVIPFQGEQNMEQKMLLHNQIHGILPCKINAVDNQMVIEYEIDGRISMKQYFEQKQIGSEDVFFIISGMVDALQNLHHYLLRANGVLLELDCIFYQEEKKIIELCYLPNYEEDIIEKLTEFIEYLMKHMNHREESAVVLVYEFYQLLQEPNVSLALLETYRKNMEKKRQQKEELEKIVIQKVDVEEIQMDSNNSDEQSQKGKERKTNIKKKEEPREELQEKRQTDKKKMLHWGMQILSVFIAGVLLFFALSFYWKGQWKNGIIGIALFVVDLYMIWERQRSYQKAQEIEGKKEKRTENKVKQRENYFRKKKKDFSDEGEKTILLSSREQEEKSIPYLKSMDSEFHHVYLYHTPMILGSLEEAVDGMISGKGVSRIHASIEEEAARYYIRDLSSTNGTYWNGELLEAQVPRELREGDNITIGEHVYEFCMLHS